MTKLILFVFITYLCVWEWIQRATGTLWCSCVCFIGKDELQRNKIREDTYIHDAAGIFIQQLMSDATAQRSVPRVLQRKWKTCLTEEILATSDTIAWPDEEERRKQEEMQKDRENERQENGD